MGYKRKASRSRSVGVVVCNGGLFLRRAKF
jgi:hypothetical protein